MSTDRDYPPHPSDVRNFSRVVFDREMADLEKRPDKRFGFVQFYPLTAEPNMAAYHLMVYAMRDRALFTVKWTIPDVDLVTGVIPWRDQVSRFVREALAELMEREHCECKLDSPCEKHKPEQCQ